VTTARLAAVAVVVSVALVGAYVALGGTDYRPTPVADPCAAREAASGTSTEEAIQRVVLAAADASACELGVSREDLVLALRSVDRLEALAAREGVPPDEMEAAVREGLVEAVDQAEQEGLLGERTADVVRAAAQRLPLGLLLTLLRGASRLLD
jgi:hypothetical protein